MTTLEFNGNYYVFTRLEQFNYFTNDQKRLYYWTLLKYFNNYLVDNNKLSMVNEFSKLTATTKKKLLVLANNEYFKNYLINNSKDSNSVYYEEPN
jgi:hypothetical protein